MTEGGEREGWERESSSGGRGEEGRRCRTEKGDGE